MTIVLDAALLGLINGLVYALLSVGLALIFGVIGVVNFAHAEFMMLAAYVVIAIVAVTQSIWLAVAVAVVAVFVVGFAFDGLVLRRVRARSLGDFEVRSLVGSIGLSLLLSNGVFIIAGPNQVRTPGFLRGSIDILGANFSYQQLLAGAVSLVAIIGLLQFLGRTKLGMAIRAVKDEPDIVEAFGVRRDRVYAVTFGIAAGLAGLAGILIAPVQFMYPFMGTAFLLKAFVIVVMAGLGSLRGVLVAGVLLGVVEGITSIAWGAQAGQLVFFAAMVLVLFIRPQGLFGMKVRA
jgi:branched-chain amino acid transport system permease protein